MGKTITKLFQPKVIGACEELNENKITSLDLKDNDIDVVGMMYLSEALIQNQSLTELNLEGNKIGDEGIKHLAQSLFQNKTLMTLNLVDNHIGEEGIKCLAESLKNNSSLTNLDLGRMIAYFNTYPIHKAIFLDPMECYIYQIY